MAYRYVGAGMFYPNHGGFGIHIKYKTNPNRILVHELSSRHAKISTPDRDLLIVSDANHSEAIRGFDYDEFVNLSPMWGDGAGHDVDGFMMNRTQYIGKDSASPNLRINGRQPHHKIDLYADSGGFQILNERFDYIHPKELIEWYNRNVDYGIVLDFPPGSGMLSKFITKIAEAQAKATETLIKYKRDDLQLINVFHGSTAEEVAAFRAIVERPEINYTAMGGIYYHTLLQSIDHFATTMTTGRSYDKYHILGVSNIRQLYLLMRMAGKGIANISSDSSTFLQEGINKGYFVWPTVKSPPRYYKVGTKWHTASAHKVLACGCPVCQAVKYEDILAVMGGNLNGFLLMYHNLYTFSALTRSMAQITEEATAKDLKDLIRAQFQTRTNGRDEVLAGIDYVDSLAANGIDAARRKAGYFLGLGSEEGSDFVASNLFTAHETAKDDEVDEGAEEDSDDLADERFQRILDTYINSEIKEKSTKVKTKDRIRKTGIGHSKDSSGGVRAPGKIRKKPNAKNKEDSIRQRVNSEANTG